jgi:hypothetical protein
LTATSSSRPSTWRPTRNVTSSRRNRRSDANPGTVTPSRPGARTRHSRNRRASGKVPRPKWVIFSKSCSSIR